MQSSYRPPENFPLQGGGTVVVSMPEHPKDYIVWSLASFFYGNPFCLGLFAVYYSVKSRDRKMVGDMEGARTYGSTARCLNITAVILIVLLIIIPVIIAVVVINSAAAQYRDTMSSTGFGRYPRY